MSVKAVIFDLDGTLADTLVSIAYFANRALNTCGFPSIEIEKYRRLVGNGAKNLVLGMLKTVSADESEYDKVAKCYNDGYDADALYLTKPYDGILELLDELKKCGVMTAVLSNKPDRTTQKIAKALFGERLDYVLGQVDSIPRKPDPAGVRVLLEKMGVCAEECLYIGDTDTDMKTGKAAGIFTVGVLWGFRDREELVNNNADAIVSHPLEILDVL